MGKTIVYAVNSHANATRIGWHLWEIDSRFAPGSGWHRAAVFAIGSFPIENRPRLPDMHLPRESFSLGERYQRHNHPHHRPQPAAPPTPSLPCTTAGSGAPFANSSSLHDRIRCSFRGWHGWGHSKGQRPAFSFTEPSSSRTETSLKISSSTERRPFRSQKRGCIF